MRRINFPANEQETSLIRQPQLGFRRRACACGAYVRRCRCTCTLAHQKTALPSEGWRAGRGCCEFICHMPREHWNRSTVIHSSGLQHRAVSAIFPDPQSNLHLGHSATPSRIPRRHKNSGYNKSRRRVPSQQRKALLLVVQRKLITASSEAENLRAEWKMKLTSRSQTQLTG